MTRVLFESMGKFPDHIPPTKIAYFDGRPQELHLRKCKFVLERPSGKTRERIFDQGVITIGAMEENDLILNEETVSRFHCKVIQEPDGYLLVDLDSTNGTFINHVRVREAYLEPGCSIQLGQSDLKFFFADERIPVRPSDKESLGLLIGRNVKMREIYDIIEKIAPTGTTVIIEGETGTGKEVVAQTIHQLSPRKTGPMMVFDCGAIPENLIESELFGHEKGSFTGAIMTRQGLFEMAHGGSIFLDELGELNLELQPKLLRVLEQREIRRVGASKPLKVDVRVIAATNRNLEEEVKGGRFRQDLFYRLSVVRILLPPLRERTEDIPLLIESFLQSQPFNKRPDGSHKVEGVEADAMVMLQRYQWPGNVRELLNVIERAVSFSEGAKIRTKDLPTQLHRGDDEDTSNPGRGRGSSPREFGGASPPYFIEGDTFKDAKERWIASFEQDYLQSLLKKHNGNISQAARDANIDRKYFRKLMNKYGIDSNVTDDSDE